MTTTVGSTSVAAGAVAPRSLRAPILCGCALAAGAAYVAAIDPNEGGVFVPCPFRTVTGWWCPGCGLTRATHHLLRGDFAEAHRHHLFVIGVLAVIVASWVTWMVGAARGTPPGVRWLPAWLLAGVTALLVAFAVVRNLPGVEGLRG
jgi:hypothetical protein